MIETYRKWFILFIVFFSGAFMIGMNTYSFGLFIEPLENTFNWSREEISFGYAVSIFSSLLAPIIGRIVDIRGSKLVLIISLIIVSIGFGLRPYMNNIYHWIILNSLVFIGFPGTLMITGVLIQDWFPKSRGRMVGIAMSGNNFGGLIIPLITFYFISNAGWKITYSIYSILVLSLAILGILFLKNSPNQSKDSIIEKNNQKKKGINTSIAIRSSQFYTLALGITFACFTYNAIMPQIIPHLTTEGFSSTSATIAVSYIAIMGMGSKYLFGRLSENFSSLNLMAISVAIQGISLLIILFANGNTLIIWLGVFIFGLGFGGMGVLIILTITECFGLKSFSTLYGLVSLAGVWATFLAPWMMGRLFDNTNSYRFGHFIVVIVFGLGIFFLITTKMIIKEQNYLKN
jgi:MFS family permease